MMNIVSLLAASLLAVLPAIAAPQCPRSDFCVTITPSGSNAVVTVSTSYVGYGALAIGSLRMAGSSPTWIGWTNSGGGQTIGQRTTYSHSTPSFNYAVGAVGTPGGASALGGVTFSFEAPLSSLGSGSMPAMMAASNNPPFNRDDPASGLYRHDTYVSFYLEIPSPSVANPPPPPPPATTAPAVVAPPPTTAAAVAPAVTTTVVGTTTATATTSKAAATTIINIPTFVHSNGSSTYCYDTKLTFCVATIKDASTITFTMYSTVKGWISIGTGSFMDGSTMFVAWKDGSDVLITQRIGKGHDQPPLASKPIFTKVATPASVAIPAAFSGLIASFQIPASSNLVSASGPTNFIFATSNDPVAKPSDVNSMYPQHSVSGAFTLDVSKGGVGTTAEKSGVDLILLHGIAMFIAWAVVPPVAIFIARYLKKALGHKWYLSHVGLFLFGTGGLIVVGLVTVEVNLAPGVTRFIGSSVHGIMGTVIALALYPLQCVLGFASNYFFDENREKIAIIDQVHWWVGRTIVLLAIVNMYLGLVQYGAGVGWVVAYWLFVLLIPAGLIFYGEKKLGGVTHHVGGKIGDSSELKAINASVKV